MAATFHELDWYESPLYYDIIFEEDTDLEGAFLEVMLARYGPGRGRRVLEPACGSGRLLAEMARRDYRVTGFDLSREMLAFARERLALAGLRAKLKQARLEAFELPGRGCFLEVMLARYGPGRGRRVLEPACGSGRLLAEMARRDYRVTGFDLSREMLAFARERLALAGLRAKLKQARLEAFELPGRFELAHCLVSTFKYLLTEADAREHLRCVARALVPGGIYVLGFHLSEYDSPHKSRERWVAERDGAHVVCNIQGWPADRRKRVERVRSRLVVKERGEERRMETNWVFRTYDAAQVRRLLRSVPELDHIATFDFSYDASAERELSDDQLDCVLVLRRS